MKKLFFAAALVIAFAAPALATSSRITMPQTLDADLLEQAALDGRVLN
jgi:hypothetical protein